MRNNAITVHIDNPISTTNRILHNRQIGLFVATTWHRYFDKFTPMQEGILKSNVSYEPFKIHYNSPYAHYIHEGVKYVDPEYNVSGWFSESQGRWFSRPNIIKIPTTEHLHYSQEQSPLAQSHWERAAYTAHKDDVARQITQYLRRLQ